jgi:tetratricopeptide (TPR) repeat protein
MSAAIIFLLLLVFIFWGRPEENPQYQQLPNGSLEKIGSDHKSRLLRSEDSNETLLEIDWVKRDPHIRMAIENVIGDRSWEEVSLVEIGKALSDLGHKNYGRELFERALKDNPFDLEALIALGEIHFDLGEMEQFKTRFQELLRNHPDNAEIHLALAGFFSDILDVDQAQQILKNGMEINPENSRFKHIYGDFLGTNNLLPEALSQYEAAIKMNNQDAEAYFKLGEIYQKTEDKEKAETCFGMAAHFSIEFAEVIEDLKKDKGISSF